jgi:hypothetical protein
MSLDFDLNCRCCNQPIYEASITHNLTTMAHAAGIYEALWEPQESGYNQAEDIIEILEQGLKALKRDPEFYKKYNAENGWGTYKHFVPFVENILKACKQHPTAVIRTWV